MADKPILIIQMQRLGDLVMTYPLMGWLAQLYPNNPIWVVGEESFFSELIDFSPSAVFFPYGAAPMLRKNAYKAVVNLSHRPEAAELAGSLDAEELLGPYRDANTGAVFIRGDWQLYRASLVNNNRYNLFHWADMNLLDIVPPKRLPATIWTPLRERSPSASAHIGLFLGASEKAKHPDAAFWATLAANLLHAGHRPVLLGGKAEKALGLETATLLKTPQLNLTGRFGLRDLSFFFNNLDILITPDTGPMHLATWTSTPVLNISTGPVNVWETGPFAAGHHVLRASLPCVGCWQCVQTSVICKERLDPKRTAFIAHEIVTGKKALLHRATLPEQELLLTGRNKYGLYDLTRLIGEEQPRHVAALFWRAFFGHVFGVLPEEELTQAWNVFQEASPGNAPRFAAALVKLSRDFTSHLRNANTATVTSHDFWTSFPPPLRPFTSYLHLRLQNGSFAKPAFADALRLVEKLISLKQ